jgi:hypothetical protein
MKYYGLLMLVLSCLMALVFVEGENLFGSAFFTISYGAMALALVIGSKRKESLEVDIAIGLILIFSVAFLSTSIIIEMLTNTFTGIFAFKIAIIVSIDYAAIGFLRLAKQIRDMQRIVGEGRYAIG